MHCSTLLSFLFYLMILCTVDFGLDYFAIEGLSSHLAEDILVEGKS